MTALSEMILPGEGSIYKPNRGYTFCWKDKWKNEGRIHGVGLATRTTFLCQLPNFPTYIDEWLIKLHFPLNPYYHVTVISAFAPTITVSEEVEG